jgi:phage head maturation protease
MKINHALRKPRVDPEGREFFDSSSLVEAELGWPEATFSEKDVEQFAQEAGVKADPERVVTFKGSDETTDRYGDIIRVKGWELAAYKRNPVLLWAHEYGIPPLGRTLRVWKDNDQKALLFMCQFADEATAGELGLFADDIFRMYKSGMLNATSVGFMPIEYNRPKTAEEREQLGLGEYGYEYTKQELLELSCVPVPANPPL